LAQLAHQVGKEVMLHMPMQSVLDGDASLDTLHVNMQEKDVVSALLKAFKKVPHAVGMNNHQGSLLTRHPGHMLWVMKQMKRDGRYFVDSRTSTETVAESVAREQGVPVLRRDVFLDNKVDVASIRIAFNRLLQLAKKRGHAVGIGHPHPETLAVLKEMLPKMRAMNIQIVPVSSQLTKKMLALK
jgi:hypothetical protein